MVTRIVKIGYGKVDIIGKLDSDMVVRAILYNIRMLVYNALSKGYTAIRHKVECFEMDEYYPFPIYRIVIYFIYVGKRRCRKASIIGKFNHSRGGISCVRY